MASGKEIRQKISSVRNTQKITKAMEMVAASRMRKTQQRMDSVRPYSEHIRRLMAHLNHANIDYRHPFLEAREVKNVGVIVVSSDRGLCGGLNANVLRKLLQSIQTWRQQSIGCKLAVVGNKAQTFFKVVGGDVQASIVQLGDEPQLSQMLGLIQAMVKAYEEGEIDALYIMHNTYVNTMTQAPTLAPLLPISLVEDELKDDRAAGQSSDAKLEYMFEPGVTVLMDALLKRYVESLVHNAVIENIACEQAARMIAMKNATDNAGGMIDDLNLAYNKARQAAITQELSEIIGGAAAV